MEVVQTHREVSMNFSVTIYEYWYFYQVAALSYFFHIGNIFTLSCKLQPLDLLYV